LDRYQRSGEQSGSDLGQQASGLASNLITYLRTRQPEHWLFFAVGIIVGLLIG
jgi:hypothetical protein